jgi:stage V sporulation protein D (sporulation-specific penicillin-binding protein)
VVPLSNTTIATRKRIYQLFIVLGVLLFGLTLRLGWVQFVRGDELYQMALDNRMRDVPVEAKRGTIYDRNHKELAISVSSDALYAIPPEVKGSGQAEQIARALAPIIGMDEETIYNKITKNSSFEWIKFKVMPEHVQTIQKLRLKGIDFAEKSQRFYPKDNLAAHVLGIAGIDNIGLEGIDKYCDQELGGVPGRIVIEYDARGREIPQAMHMYIPPQDGHSLELTIDETIQYIAERELDKAFVARQAKSATIVVMDPHTGEILALACRPDFNPNSYADYPAANRRNIAVSNAYEPGSVFKIVTASAALEEGVVRPESPFNCTGGFPVGKHVIHCSGRNAHGSESFIDVVANSCNVGFATVGLRLGVDPFYSYLRAFGFGEKTGIDLPGEAVGILVPQAQAKDIHLATMAMGQANAVTPIQMITAVSAAANGGNLMKPQLVKRVLDVNGEVIQEMAPQVIRRVISEKTSAEMRSILEGVVADGTGRNGQVDGYRVAGKTGTAQKPAPGGGYMTNEYVASFVGFAPADQPRIAVIVLVDAPQGYPYFGGWVAAPVFQAVVKDTLRYLGVPYQLPLKAAAGTPEDPAPQGKIVPDVVGLPLDDAKQRISKAGFVPVVDGEGERVWGQTPPGETQVRSGTRILLYPGPNEARNEETHEVTVPDVTGKTIREAGSIVGAAGLRIKAEGSGVAVKQSISPGTVVKAGTTLDVEFKSAASP